MSKTHSPRIPISLSEQDRKHLQMLADLQGVSLAEAARRAVLDAYERTQEAEVRPRLEDPLRVELEQMKARLLGEGPLRDGKGFPGVLLTMAYTLPM